MTAQSLERALRTAAIMRQLRDVEMGDARRWRDVFGEPADDATRDYLRRLVAPHVTSARKWNRQLVIAQRALRNALHARAVARYPFPGAGLVRQVRP